MSLCDSLASRMRRLTECSVCFGTFDQPKMLPCLHTFCLGCLDSLINEVSGRRSVCCPLCRQEFEIEKGNANLLPTNVLVATIIESTNSCSNEADDSGLLVEKIADKTLPLEFLSHLKLQVSDSKDLVFRNLEQIRHDVGELKQHLQQKLDDDYNSIMQRLDKFERTHKSTSLHYLSALDDLKLQNPNRSHCNSDEPSKNPFCQSCPSFYPKVNIRNQQETNLLGELQWTSPDVIKVNADSSTGNLSLTDVLVANNLSLTRTTVGVAVTRLYVCTVETLSSDVNVFDIASLKLLKIINVPELRHPQDMCCCPATDRLFIADSYSNTLEKVELEIDSCGQLALPLEPTNVSAHRLDKSVVWVTCMYANELLEVDGDSGELLRKIGLPPSIVNVSHALCLGLPRVLILSYGVFMSDPKHQVAVADEHNGKILKDRCFGNEPNSGPGCLYHPCYLTPVVDPKTSNVVAILVADQSNNRIVALKFPSMEFISSYGDYLASPKSCKRNFKQPGKVVYDAVSRLLVVVEKDAQGRVLVFKRDFCKA